MLGVRPLRSKIPEILGFVPFPKSIKGSSHKACKEGFGCNQQRSDVAAGPSAVCPDREKQFQSRGGWATVQGIDTAAANGNQPDALYSIIEGKRIGTFFVGRY